MKLVLVEEDDRIDGEMYLTSMKHGWLEGQWSRVDGVCRGYYWTDMEWFPYSTYRMEQYEEVDE